MLQKPGWALPWWVTWLECRLHPTPPFSSLPPPSPPVSSGFFPWLAFIWWQERQKHETIFCCFFSLTFIWLVTSMPLQHQTIFWVSISCIMQSVAHFTQHVDGPCIKTDDEWINNKVRTSYYIFKTGNVVTDQEVLARWASGHPFWGKIVSLSNCWQSTDM